MAKRESIVERRCSAGASIIKTITDAGGHYTFADSGRTARADVVERLIKSGFLAPAGDGLFADDAQTWRAA